MRFRQDHDPSLLNELMYSVSSKLGAFLMERKTLLGIKRRVEAA